MPKITNMEKQEAREKAEEQELELSVEEEAKIREIENEEAAKAVKKAGKSKAEQERLEADSENNLGSSDIGLKKWLSLRVRAASKDVNEAAIEASVVVSFDGKVGAGMKIFNSVTKEEIKHVGAIDIHARPTGGLMATLVQFTTNRNGDYVLNEDHEDVESRLMLVKVEDIQFRS